MKTILHFYRKLRDRKYEIGIVPSTIKVSRTSHIINFFSGAKIRVGVKSIDGIENHSYKLLNVKTDFSWKSKHQLDRNLEVVRQIDCNLSDSDKASLKITYSNEEINFARVYIKENFPDKNRKIIGFHPGAGKTDNMWATKNFIDLIIKLFKNYNNYVLLTMGKIDSDVISIVERKLTQHNIYYKILGPIPIKRQAAIISSIDLYITNDTGSMHIAGFSDARMISLFGPTDPNEWAPTGKHQYSIKSPTGKIEDLPVDEVLHFVKKILPGKYQEI